MFFFHTDFGIECLRLADNILPRAIRRILATLDAVVAFFGGVDNIKMHFFGIEYAPSVTVRTSCDTRSQIPMPLSYNCCVFHFDG